MAEFQDLRRRARTTRSDRERARQRLYDARAKLRGLKTRIEAQKRTGGIREDDGVPVASSNEGRRLLDLHRETSDLIVTASADLAQAAKRAGTAYEDFVELFVDPRDAVANLSATTPFLLLPVRVEARFFPGELRVRIFPDAVSVETHESALTEAELAAGRDYWVAVWRAGRGEAAELAAWRALVADYDAPRAAWIARTTTPTNDAVARPTAPVPDDQPLAVEPEWPEVELREDTWTLPPRARTMPDRFVVTSYRSGQEIHRVVGRPVPDPLTLGPDPLQLAEEIEQVGPDLDLGESMRWFADFDEAEKIGMAVRVPIGDADRSAGFDRLLVLGVKASADRDEAQQTLEALFEGHHYGEGLSLLPIGTPTNNTGTDASGYDRSDDSDDSSFLFERRGALYTPSAGDEHFKNDAQRLCESLGIDDGILQNVGNANQRGLHLAEAMNRALFRGTIGYYLDQMMEPAIDQAGIRHVRSFFTENVRARGSVSSLRIGLQPYGVLLTTAHSRFQPTKADLASYGRIWRVIEQLDPVWAVLAEGVSRAEPGPDADATILDIIGLHASSVEYHTRKMVGPEYLKNLMAFAGAEQFIFPHWWSEMLEFSFGLLASLGYEITESEDVPEIFNLSFSRTQHELIGPLVDYVDDRDNEKLSEHQPVRPIAETVGNYIHWLARSDIDTIRKQDFGKDGDTHRPVPRALLYLLLRHGLTLEYFTAGARLVPEIAEAGFVRLRDPELVNIRKDTPEPTKWDYLELEAASIEPGLPVKTILTTRNLRALGRPELTELVDVKDALDELAELPTAVLERLMAEHVDLCSYRLDAWKAAFIERRLRELRTAAGPTTPGAALVAGVGTGVAEARRDDADDVHRPELERGVLARRVSGGWGVYLGAYGWLENLRARPPGTPVAADDPAVVALGGAEAIPGEGDIVERRDNGGYIHASSMPHASTAAILRAGYLAHASPEQQDLLSINLSSRRVRDALGYLEGIRSGESLSALLGYRIERGMHDASDDGVELDQFVFDLRQRFPLVGDKVHAAEEPAEVDEIEARFVLDGAALIEAHRDEGTEYPWGASNMPPAGSAEAARIVLEVGRASDALDAVGDLGIAECVFQVVQGNFERAAAAMNAVSSAGVPPEPDVVKTLRGGIGLTHRVGLILDAAADPATIANPWPAVALTPRSRAEPRLNGWLAERMGAPTSIKVKVVFAGVDPPNDETTIELVELGLQPIDIVLVAGRDLAQATAASEIERRAVAAARAKLGLNDGPAAELRWTDRASLGGPEELTFFECLPLWSALRETIGGARYLHAEDFLPPSDDSPVADDRRRLDHAELLGRLQEGQTDLSTAVTNLGNAADATESAIGSGTFSAGEAGAMRAALGAASLFGAPNAVPETSVAATAEVGTALLAQSRAVHEALTKRRDEAAVYLSAPAEETATQRIERLLNAGAAIYGRDLRIMPRFTLGNAAELGLAAADSALLLDNPPAPPLAVQEWLEGVARVREQMARLETIRLTTRMFGTASSVPNPMQLPYRDDDRWAALPTTAAAPVRGDTLSMVIERPAGFDATGTYAGLMVDEWVESIPSETVTTGLTFNFDQPSSEPPNALLLVVPPRDERQWSWNDLIATLSDTLAEARKRAVEPDELQKTALGQLLPAITPSVTRYGLTMGVSFIANILEAQLLQADDPD